MKPRGKSLNIYLMDGTPSGRIKCTMSNWTGVAYKLPRTDIDKCKDRKDLYQSGVYFLFGVSEKTDDNVVYIGQAGIRKSGEGILCRLQEHRRDHEKDFWTEAVVFTTSNNSFGQTEISFLENRFTKISIAAKRYVVKNENDPSHGNVTEEKESELEEFIDYAKIMMGVLGHKVFEPLIPAVDVISPTVAINETVADEAKLYAGQTLYIINRQGAYAKAILTPEGMVVLANSVIRKNTVPSCPPYVDAAREANKEHIDSNNALTEDILFKSPSAASSFVLGSSTNGNIEWQTVEGRTLKAVEFGNALENPEVAPSGAN